MTIKIVIADDHHIVRKGLTLFINTQEDMEVIGEAKNGQEAVEITNKLQPDIVIMDLSMPILDGLQATKRIKENNPEMKIMILTSFSDQDHVIPALEAGAAGYQLKDSNPDDLIIAVRKLMNGEHQFPEKVTSQLLSHLTGKKDKTNHLLDELTKREKEVLQEIACGKSNKEIAFSLEITEKTVKTHVSNILMKLQLQDRTQAALYAVKHGFVTDQNL
jgi:DNA-binding NarL/FixJ family response regulator